MDSFKGKYERTSAENYEEFLKVNKVYKITYVAVSSYLVLAYWLMSSFNIPGGAILLNAGAGVDLAFRSVGPMLIDLESF